jgi:CheY-like chemotaxis protein
MGDESQLQNAMLNLAINARDAMPHGGNLDFSSKNVFIEKNASNEFDENFAEGLYLQIAVSDTGVGISTEHLSQIFEPFFTTKEPGQGTGMGLAAVYGTVQGHNGQINVYSEKGRGTAFRIYLPVATESIQAKEADEPLPRPENAHYRIWVVDDEKAVREMLTQILKSEGHTVNSFETATDALDLFKKEKDQVDLIILDMIMPCMSGHEAFHAFREIDPEAKILISSGFSSDHLAQDLLKSGAAGFLQKPYQIAELTARINEAINS